MPDQYTQPSLITTMKRCSKCKRDLPRTEFYRQKAKPDGLQNYCKECSAKQVREYGPKHYAENREAYAAYAKTAYVNNRDAYLERAKRNAEANPERTLATKRRWVANNPEKKKAAARKWRLANQAIEREYVRRRYTWRKTGLITPFTLVQLREKWAYWGGRCWMCGADADATDHVKPLAKGGRDVLANMRPACHSCNSRKSAKWPYPLVRNIPKWE